MDGFHSFERIKWRAVKKIFGRYGHHRPLPTWNLSLPVMVKTGSTAASVGSVVSVAISVSCKSHSDHQGFFQIVDNVLSFIKIP